MKLSPRIDDPSTMHSPTPTPADPGAWMHALATELYPLHRSVTGHGVRATFEALGRHIALEVHEVASGTAVLDWHIPDEWNVQDAYVADASGKRLIDHRALNLHLASYSRAVREHLTWDELRAHLFTLPEHPDWVPYRTLHGGADWAFCLSQNHLEALQALEAEKPGGSYEVVVDTSSAPGHLSYAEFFVPGRSDEEVLISTHVCHPSLANDNLSGIAVATLLAMHLRGGDRHHGYRFVFVPATLGAITWLALNEQRLERIRHGLILAGLGDPGALSYKRSRRSDAQIDRIVATVLADAAEPYELLDFEPWGYDERQYCSPGFDLPMGRLTRTPDGRYPEYHTSGDDLDFVRPEALADSFSRCLEIVEAIERNRSYRNLSPKGEPQLGRRGLYEAFAPGQHTAEAQHAVQWVLSLSDGSRSLLDMAERSHMPFMTLAAAADSLVACDLLEVVHREDSP